MTGRYRHSFECLTKEILVRLQDNQIPLFKTLRTNYPARNWCSKEALVDDSYWTLERCITEAAKYQTREDWEKSSPNSYQKAINRGWLTKCTTHIIGFRRKPAVPAVWTLERCLETAKLCQKRTEFKQKFHYPYEKARQNGWLEICCAHMK